MKMIKKIGAPIKAAPTEVHLLAPHILFALKPCVSDEPEKGAISERRTGILML